MLGTSKLNDITSSGEILLTKDHNSLEIITCRGEGGGKGLTNIRLLVFLDLLQALHEVSSEIDIEREQLLLEGLWSPFRCSNFQESDAIPGK